MDTIKYLIGVVIGLACIAGAAWSLVEKWRRRRHYLRAPGVYVAHRDARGEMGMSPATHKRASSFRFTLPDGRVVETESNVQSFPGPKPGRRLTVVYDPKRPYQAEPSGRFVIVLLFEVFVLVFGLILAVGSLSAIL